MVKLECIEASSGCKWMTQDLPFEQAEKVLQMHLKRCPVNAPSVAPAPAQAQALPPPRLSQHQQTSVSSNNRLSSLDGCYFAFLMGLPLNLPGIAVRENIMSAGCPGDICMVETEAGKLTGEAVIKLATREELETVLSYSFRQFGWDTVIAKEVSSAVYFKYARRSGNEMNGSNVYIRLKGMEWSVTEEAIKQFLSDCRIARIIMTKTPTGRPTGEAFVQLESEADTDLAKKHNRQYLGRRFVVIEEVFEEQFNMVDSEGMEPAPKRMALQRFDWMEGRIQLKNLPSDATSEQIVHFLTSKGDCDVEEVEEVSKYTNSAVVKCKTDKDVIRGLTCNNSTLNGRAINIERIPKSG